MVDPAFLFEAGSRLAAGSPVNGTLWVAPESSAFTS